MENGKVSDVKICKTVITVISFTVVCCAQPQFPWPAIARLNTLVQSKLWLNTTFCCIYNNCLDSSSWLWTGKNYILVRMMAFSFHCPNLNLALDILSNSSSHIPFVHLSAFSDYFFTPRGVAEKCLWLCTVWTGIEGVGINYHSWSRGGHGL